jgi:hypothetical protein
MTESQSNQLREIIDLNWNISHEANPVKKWDMVNELNDKKRVLRDDMGHEEYDRFMDNGRKMFAPAD